MISPRSPASATAATDWAPAKDDHRSRSLPPRHFTSFLIWLSCSHPVHKEENIPAGIQTCSDSVRPLARTQDGLAQGVARTRGGLAQGLARTQNGCAQDSALKSCALTPLIPSALTMHPFFRQHMPAPVACRGT